MKRAILLTAILFGFASCQVSKNKITPKNEESDMTNLEIVQQYFSALEKGDMAKVESLFAEDLVWHQPGKGVQSGTFMGKQAVFTHLGKMERWRLRDQSRLSHRQWSYGSGIHPLCLRKKWDFDGDARCGLASFRGRPYQRSMAFF